MYIWSAWKTVFSRDMLLSWAMTREEMEEERRLCYVGCCPSRTEKLSLSCARSRFRNGEQQYNRPHLHS